MMRGDIWAHQGHCLSCGKSSAAAPRIDCHEPRHEKYFLHARERRITRRMLQKEISTAQRPASEVSPEEMLRIMSEVEVVSSEERRKRDPPKSTSREI